MNTEETKEEKPKKVLEVATVLNKPSGLITTRNTLSKREHKLFNSLLKIAMDDLKDNDDHDGTFETSFDFIQRATAMSKNNDIKVAFRSLLRNGIEFKNSLFKASEKRWNVEANFLSTFAWRTDESAIEFEMPKVILGLLKEEGFRNVYARLNLQLMANFEHKHSLWLYELINDYKRIGSITYDIDAIRDLAGLKDKQYPQIFDLKRKVLNPAMTEINKKTSFKIEATYNKQGRKIKSITFKFHDNSNKETEQKKYFRAWLQEEWGSRSLNLKRYGEIYFSKNKSGNYLAYDVATRKPLPKEIAYDIYDYLYQERQVFYSKNLLPGLDEEFTNFDEVLDAFIEAKKFDEIGGRS